jgi:hypothetical protein
MGVVEFDPGEFREQYPQFTRAEIPDGRLRQAFRIACLMLDNTEGSRVPEDEREILLSLLVCHLATLALWGVEGRSGPVASASEGSVSVSFSVPRNTDRAYFQQTPCGGTFWQITRKYAVGGRHYPPRIRPPQG